MIQINLDDEDTTQPAQAEQPTPPAIQVQSASPTVPTAIRPVANQAAQAPLWLVLALAGVICFLLGRSAPYRSDELPNDDRRENVTPVDPKPKPDDRKPTVDPKTITLVVIHDKDVTNSTPEYSSTLQDDQFATWCKKSIKDFEVLTTEDEIAKQVLAGGNFKVPVVIAYTGKKYLWDMPLPKENMESVQKKLESK